MSSSKRGGGGLSIHGGGRKQRQPYLSSGYGLDRSDRELVIPRREDGSEAAAFGATGADPGEIERAAWEDFRARGRSPGVR